MRIERYLTYIFCLGVALWPISVLSEHYFSSEADHFAWTKTEIDRIENERANQTFVFNSFVALNNQRRAALSNLVTAMASANSAAVNLAVDCQGISTSASVTKCLYDQRILDSIIGRATLAISFDRELVGPAEISNSAPTNIGTVVSVQSPLVAIRNRLTATRTRFQQGLLSSGANLDEKDIRDYCARISKVVDQVIASGPDVGRAMRASNDLAILDSADGKVNALVHLIGLLGGNCGDSASSLAQLSKLHSDYGVLGAASAGLSSPVRLAAGRSRCKSRPLSSRAPELGDCTFIAVSTSVAASMSP